MEQNEKQLEIDLIGLWHYLKKRIVIILAVGLIGAVAGFLYAEICIDQVYVAETRVYVLSRSSTTEANISDFQLSDQILKDYQVIITGKNVTREVISELKLNMTPGALGNRISVTAPEGTRVLQITVTDQSAQNAANIANKVCEVASRQIRKITDADALHQLYEAEVPAGPAGPNITRYMMIWAAIGLVAVCGVLTAVFVLDDTIRTEEDVERHLGLSVLGVIPDSQDMSTASQEIHAKRKRPSMQTKDEK